MIRLFFPLLLLGLFAFWGWNLVECATKESDRGNTKVVWTLIILLGNIVGASMYYLVRRPQRWRELGR